MANHIFGRRHGQGRCRHYGFRRRFNSCSIVYVSSVCTNHCDLCIFMWSCQRDLNTRNLVLTEKKSYRICSDETCLYFFANVRLRFWAFYSDLDRWVEFIHVISFSLNLPNIKVAISPLHLCRINLPKTYFLHKV